MTRIVRKIAPAQPPAVIRPRRVAAYARVSVPTERLLHSLDEQISYYSALIQSTPGWEYAGVFADRGVSGTQTVSRDEFQRMLSECEAGHIDLILTKSLSRFARNTVDTLETVRRLKRLGVEVRFEKENINTLDESGELMITLFASFAQEESRSISENCKWGIRKRFEEGMIGVANKHVLGYRYDDALKQYVIIPEEAETVRAIFRLFLNGASLRQICDALHEKGMRTITGRRFVETSIANILKHEIYAGDLRRQKTYTADPIGKRKVRNNGVLPQFYYQDCHEAIIDRDTWERTQAEYRRRQALFAPVYCFTGAIFCGACGMKYTRRPPSKEGLSHATWFCRAKKEVGMTCESAVLSEDLLKRVCAKVLGLDAFDENEFANRVRRVTVAPDGSLDFDLLNGESAHWHNRHIEDYYHPATVTDAFQKRIRCGVCGELYHRTRSAGRVTWHCEGRARRRTDCTNRSYADFMLRQITAEVMGTEDFDEQAFRKSVDYIEIAPGDTFIYHFKNGRTAAWQKA